MSDERTVSRRSFLAIATIVSSTSTRAQTAVDPSSPAITLLFSMTVKPDRMDQFATVAQSLITTTRTEDAGCIAYIFLQQEDSPREYVLYEQWRDRAALDAHLARLRRVFGASSSGRGLPPALLDFFETTRTVRYRPVG